MMSKDSIYAVALVAVWLPAEWCGDLNIETGRVAFWFLAEPPIDSRLKLEHGFTLGTDVVVASSEEEAKEKSLAWFRETYPASAGWTSHAAAAQIVDILPVVDEKLAELGFVRKSAVTENESNDDPDLIM